MKSEKVYSTNSQDMHVHIYIYVYIYTKTKRARRARTGLRNRTTDIYHRELYYGFILHNYMSESYYRISSRKHITGLLYRITLQNDIGESYDGIT